MAKYYPIYLNLTRARVLIVGAGAVAWQKIPALLESEAKVRVVAPEALSQIEALASAGKLEWLKKNYETHDLADARLVIAATDDTALQERVAADARVRSIWVNVVDVTPLCDFIAPAVISRGDVQLAISTAGASPALAKFLREKFEPLLGEEYGQLAAVLQRRRPEILKLSRERRQAVWEAIINQDFIDRVKREGTQAVETRLQELLHESTPR